MTEVTMEKIISLAKRRGFVYQGSDIYGGLAGTWDYGPLGVELKNNIKQLWWRMFVQGRDDMCGLDASILMSARVWEASGHVSGFSDPFVECLNKDCKNRRNRVDQIVEEGVYKAFAIKLKNSILATKVANVISNSVIEKFKLESDKEFQDQISFDSLKTIIDDFAEFEQYTGTATQAYLNTFVKCPSCEKKQWGVPKRFNMMFKTNIGVTDDESSVSYLRPETAGGIFVNFKNVVDSIHPKLPFGIAQIGKAFRNEIAPRDFIFRVRELEQMEIEYFVRPDAWKEAFEEWRKNVHVFNAAIGITAEAVHELEVEDGDRAHYSKRTIDFEFDFPFGRKELYGLAYRGDFDLSAHEKGSSVDLKYVDSATGEKFVPHVIEPSFGVERTMLAVLASAYTEDELGGEPRTYLKFNRVAAPIKAAVFPLLKNKPELVAKAREIYLALKQEVPQIMWDDNGNIGKRYRRQDEIGTPVCITVDFDTLENDTVTVRDRDTGEQERVSIADLRSRI